MDLTQSHAFFLCTVSVSPEISFSCEISVSSQSRRMGAKKEQNLFRISVISVCQLDSSRKMANIFAISHSAQLNWDSQSGREEQIDHIKLKAI